ncbi:MAG: hypothetical protein ACE5GQ_01755 [Nitrospinales bacterium]
MAKFIKHSEGILGGKIDESDFGLNGDFKLSLDKMLNQAKEKYAAEAESAKILSIVENMPTNILFADKDLKLQYINPQSKESLYSLQQHLPIPVENMIG